MIFLTKTIFSRIFMGPYGPHMGPYGPLWAHMGPAHAVGRAGGRADGRADLPSDMSPVERRGKEKDQVRKDLFSWTATGQVLAGPISDCWSNFVCFGFKIGFLTKFLDDSAWFLLEKLKKHVFSTKNPNI